MSDIANSETEYAQTEALLDVRLMLQRLAAVYRADFNFRSSEVRDSLRDDLRALRIFAKARVSRPLDRLFWREEQFSRRGNGWSMLGVRLGQRRPLCGPTGDLP